MTDQSRTTDEDRTHTDRSDGFGRREFVALGAGASATLLAGCAGDGAVPSTDGSGGGTDSQTTTGSFRLLISDAPADIADFDRLDVRLSEARVFEAGGEDDEEGDDDGNETDVDDETDGNVSDPETDDGQDDSEAEDAEEDDDEESDDGEGGEDGADDETDDDEDGDETDDDEDGDETDDDDRGFTVIDLDGATVDLTQVIEDDAIAVFDGELPAGSYEKIELAVSDVQGIVDGGEVDVKLPSEKLQITNGFEVTPDESVSFVFDINVVKRGPNNGYILKPVISGSGVAGRDVEVNEIDDEEEEDDSEEEEDDSEEQEDDSEDEEEAETEDDESSDDGGNSTDAGGADDDGAGNETTGYGG
jgi:hypothetical protein